VVFDDKLHWNSQIKILKGRVIMALMVCMAPKAGNAATKAEQTTAAAELKQRSHKK
jgi:hypothetical protein